MLFDVGDGDHLRLFSADEISIAGEQASLTVEQAVAGKASDQSLEISRKNSASLAAVHDPGAGCNLRNRSVKLLLHIPPLTSAAER